MKTILVLSILFSAIAGPALGALTDADLDKIRLIVKEEIKTELAPIKSDISTLKEDVARLDGRMTGVEKQVSHATNVTYGLIALIIVAIGIPLGAAREIATKSEKSKNLGRKSKPSNNSES